MSDGVLSVLTYKSVETLLSDGGTQSWALNRARAKACKYVVVCRNGNHPGVEGSERHGSAFMIGVVSNVIPSTDTKGRWLVTFDRYALCDYPDLWSGRNPVAYWTMEDYPEIHFDRIEFTDMPAAKSSKSGKLTIEEAKKGLSLTFGVDPSAIEITIRG